METFSPAAAMMAAFDEEAARVRDRSAPQSHAAHRGCPGGLMRDCAATSPSRPVPAPDSIAGRARRASVRRFLGNSFGSLVTDEMVEATIAELATLTEHGYLVVQERRSRATGTTVQVIDNRDGSFDSSDDNGWFTLCADHGGVCSHPTRRLAMDWAPVPDKWCPTCQGDVPDNEGT